MVNSRRGSCSPYGISALESPRRRLTRARPNIDQQRQSTRDDLIEGRALRDVYRSKIISEPRKRPALPPRARLAWAHNHSVAEQQRAAMQSGTFADVNAEHLRAISSTAVRVMPTSSAPSTTRTCSSRSAGISCVWTGVEAARSPGGSPLFGTTTRCSCRVEWSSARRSNNRRPRIGCCNVWPTSTHARAAVRVQCVRRAYLSSRICRTKASISPR